jgi:meromycolic acid enoyl-[acyl-carrier-protein] reductase
MGLLDGKRIVITGVLTDASLAYGVAKVALEQGADIVLTGAGRALSLTQRTARKLGDGLDVFEFDVTVPEHVESVRESVAAKWDRVDGVLHSIGYAPPSCLGDDFFATPWDDVATAIHISTYSLKTLADAFLPLMGPGGAFVGLDFDNQRAWPAYNWMGVAKSALQSLNGRSAATSWPPGRCARWPPSRSPGSRCSRTRGTAGLRLAGMSTTRHRSPRHAWRSCPTGSRPPPARSSTSTAATTPWVRETRRRLRRRRIGGRAP